MAEERDIYLVTMDTGTLKSQRAFETLEEAREFVDQEGPKFLRLVEISPGWLKGGSTWGIRPLRLGRYSDGS